MTGSNFKFKYGFALECLRSLKLS